MKGWRAGRKPYCGQLSPKLILWGFAPPGKSLIEGKLWLAELWLRQNLAVLVISVAETIEPGPFAHTLANPCCMINPGQWKDQTYDSIQGKQPCLSEPPEVKGRIPGRNHLSSHPHQSNEQGAEVGHDFLGKPLARWACSVMLSQISGSYFRKPQKKSCSSWEGQWQKLQPAATWGYSPQPVWVPLQASLWVCCPSLFIHWFRRLDLLVEQWRVVSGAAAPDPVRKWWLQKSRSGGQMSWSPLGMLGVRYATVPASSPPTPPGGEDQRLAAHKLMPLLSASMP